MSYYILPKNNNIIVVDPRIDLTILKPYISHSLYNFYNNVKKQIILMGSDLSYNDYEEINNMTILIKDKFCFDMVKNKKM